MKSTDTTAPRSLKSKVTTVTRPGSSKGSTTAVAAEGRPPFLKRRYSADKSKCLVTLRLPREAVADASQVAVAGSFNGWSLDRDPMKRLKNGTFVVELELEAGREYEFRFVIDGVRWENAWQADKYVWSDYAQSENSVIVT